MFSDGGKANGMRGFAARRPEIVTDLLQILKGVAQGDTVVASASFLIDSESRLKAAISGMGAQPGMENMPGMSHQH